jgi:hypothetical protein
MAALRSDLEPWERREFDAVRRAAVTDIIHLLRALRVVPPDIRRLLLHPRVDELAGTQP